MAKRVKDSQGRDCTVLEITPENQNWIMELAEAEGYDIAWKRIGYRRFRAVLVPASQSVHDVIFQEEYNEQKRKRVDGRCPVKTPKTIKVRCDACEEERVLTTGIMPDDERYERARIEILALIAEKYPDKYEQFALQLAGENRSAVADEQGKNQSTLYKMPKELKNDLMDLLENLWYLDV